MQKIKLLALAVSSDEFVGSKKLLHIFYSVDMYISFIYLQEHLFYLSLLVCTVRPLNSPLICKNFDQASLAQGVV